jgi:hypothetical protein
MQPGSLQRCYSSLRFVTFKRDIIITGESTRGMVVAEVYFNMITCSDSEITN